MNQKMLLIDHRPGGSADCLRVTEADIPTPAAGEVLIRVAYAGVAYASRLFTLLSLCIRPRRLMF